MKKQSKQLIGYICIILAITVSLTIAVLAGAVTVTPIENCVTVKDSAGDGTLSNGTVTIKTKGNITNTKTNTVTICNISGKKAVITFDYELTGNQEGYTGIEGLTGRKELTLGASETYTVTFTVEKYKTSAATLKLSNFTYTEVVDSAKVTMYYNDSLGSVTAGGESVSNGGDFTITDAGATLVATEKSGASFYGWLNADTNTLISSNATYTLMPSGSTMKVKAIFSDGADSGYFMNGNAVYEGLAAAISAVKSSTDKTIVQISSGTLAADTTYDITSGITLVIPYSASDSAVATSTATDTSGSCRSSFIYANASFTADYNDNSGQDDMSVEGILEPETGVYLTLTVPESTTVNVQSGGKLVIGGTIVAGSRNTNGVCGATCSDHSNLVLNGTLNVNGILSCCGYILGNGTVNVTSGGSVYQPYTIMDHRDGHYAYGAYQNEIFPFERNGMYSIQTKMVFDSGSSMYGYVDLFTQPNSLFKAQHNVDCIQIVGKSSGLYKLTEGTMTFSYDGTKKVTVTSGQQNYGYYDRVGKATVTIDGTATLGSVSISVKVGTSNYDMDTGITGFLIGYNYDYVINGSFTINSGVSILPGSVMTVSGNGRLTIGSSGSLAVFDGLRDYSVRSASIAETTWPVYHYPGTTDLQNSGFCGMGQLIVNGTLNVNGKLGGIVQTGGSTGKVVMGESAETTVTATIGALKDETSILNLMTIGASTGKTVRDLTAKIYMNGELKELSANTTYYAIDASEQDKITSYSYYLYNGSESATAVSHTENNLNATMKGNWCTTQGHNFENNTCTDCGYKKPGATYVVKITWNPGTTATYTEDTTTYRWDAEKLMWVENGQSAGSWNNTCSTVNVTVENGVNSGTVYVSFDFTPAKEGGASMSAVEQKTVNAGQSPTYSLTITPSGTPDKPAEGQNITLGTITITLTKGG